MGQFFDWRINYDNGVLLETLKALNFMYSVKIKRKQLSSGLIDNPEIIEITQDNWTGIYWKHDDHYEIFFSSEIDAMAFKLTFL